MRFFFLSLSFINSADKGYEARVGFTKSFVSPWGRPFLAFCILICVGTIEPFGKGRRRKEETEGGRKRNDRKVWAKTRFNNCARRCLRTSFLRNIIIDWYVPFDNDHFLLLMLLLLPAACFLSYHGNGFPTNLPMHAMLLDTFNDIAKHFFFFFLRI